LKRRRTRWKQRYAQTELRQIISEAINKLAPAYRIVFLLRDVESLSSEETAQLLGLSVPAVKSRLLRGRLKMRASLNKYFRFDQTPRRLNLFAQPRIPWK
jgi:RNA polymerase sigma-70 factor (ECF subfamily)